MNHKIPHCGSQKTTYFPFRHTRITLQKAQ